MSGTQEFSSRTLVHENPKYGRVLEIELIGSEGQERPFPGAKVLQEGVANHRPLYLVINLLGFDSRFGNALIGALVGAAAAMQKLGGGRKTGIVAAGRTAAELDRILPIFKIASIFGGRTFTDLESALSNLSSMPDLPAGFTVKTESRGGSTQPTVKTERKSGRTQPEVEDLSLNRSIFLALSTFAEGELSKVFLRYTGMNLPGFYHAFREACRPPMVKIETLEVGELWFYCGLSTAVTACLGEKSLLVAYGTYDPREKVIADFQSAHAWLRGNRPDLPGNSNLVFAAFEEPSGELRVRRFAPGDWMGIPRNVPLPPTEQERPFGWGE